MSSSKEKRKRSVLTIEQKLDIIEQHEHGESVSVLASKYKSGKQTIRDIVRNKQKLETFMSKADSPRCVANRKSLKGSKFQKLDDAMVEWLSQKKTEGAPVSGPMCVLQAQAFYSKLKIEGDFNASNGWLYRFKKRHGITELGIQDDFICYELETIIKEKHEEEQKLPREEEIGCEEVTHEQAHEAIDLLLHYFGQERNVGVGGDILLLRKLKEVVKENLKQ